MEENDKQEITTIVGTGEFLSTIRQMNLSITKSGEISEQEIAEIIAPLFPVSIEYLNNNGYDYREDFQENDPNIIMTALTLADYAYTQSQVITKGSVTNTLSCVLLGADAGALAGLGTKQLAKYIAKKLLSRAVPYVGTAIAVASAAVCLADL